METKQKQDRKMTVNNQESSEKYERNYERECITQTSRHKIAM